MSVVSSGRAARIGALALISFVLWHASSAAWADPQHWGFGFSYIASIEEADGQRRLAVYAPPLHAADVAWHARWLDRTTDFSAATPGALTVGDFWPSWFGTEYLAVVRQNGGSLLIDAYEPPEHFSTDAWSAAHSSSSISVSGALLGAAAGDVQNRSMDQIIAIMDLGGSLQAVVLRAPLSPGSSSWSATTLSLPALNGTFKGVACGDFWGDGEDYLAIATEDAGQTQIAYLQYSGGAFTTLVTDAATLPLLQDGGLAAADFQKDGFDALTLLKTDGDFELRVAPQQPGGSYNPGPEYTGRSYAGQWMPGNGGSESLVVMSGSFGHASDSRVAIAAGRLYGYIATNLDQRYSASTARDAQISFVARSPRKDERPPYGWPSLGETATFTANINNNGATDIPGGSVRVKAWVNRTNRNADTDPATCDSPDYDVVIGETLPAYDPDGPTYIQRTVDLTWPYSLVPAGPGATWQRLNVHDVGERWVIFKIEYAGDNNARNNRYELALHGLTFHPIFRDYTLADRNTTVSSDPAGYEYLCRKLADAVQCMWERSRTADGGAVIQRLHFDSYEIGWPDDSPDPATAWAAVQAKYEGWRQLESHFGIYQGWERFNWGDGGAELHETGHLFHPCGDLYQYTVHPTFTGAASMADGTPVQISTWMWPADSYGSGHTRISWPACEMMRTCLTASREWHLHPWNQLISDQTFVRVLDRHGQPVPDAELTLWANGQRTPIGSGATGPDGRWETTSLWGGVTRTDDYGRNYYANGHGATQIYTVKIGDHYVDATVMGIATTAGHSHYARMGHSFTDPDAWTWDFHTNYDPNAAPADFTVTAAVENDDAQLGVSGPAGTYRLYRRWEPTYILTYLGEYSAPSGTATISQNLTESDSFGGYRGRAIFEVTRVNGDAETLPQRVQLVATSNAYGLSTARDGRLLLAANYGRANPFCQIYDGTTPAQELMYHFRFGHTAQRVVESRVTPGRYYITLVYSDTTPDYRFDVAPAPTGSSGGYDVRNNINGGWIQSFTSSPPYIVDVTQGEADRFHPGDLINGPLGSATVLEVNDDKLTVDALVFASGQTGYNGTRMAGKPGTNAEMRELSDARGLDVIVHGGEDYIVIADTGNRRIVVWDDSTGYVTHWQHGETSARLAAIATHPTEPSKFFALDRRSNGSTQIYLMSFDGASLSVEPGYPFNVLVGDYSFGREMGLAAAVDPQTAALCLMVTDAAGYNRVVELTQFGGTWQTDQFFTQAQGVYAGSSNVSQPLDAAYVTVNGTLERYVQEGRDRVVFLGDGPLTNPDCNGNGVADASDISAGTSEDCDGDGTPDECELAMFPQRDCDGNGVLDDCDIAGGGGTDCNNNGLLDACEIADGLLADCNLNGVPDECDLAGGASEDCNANGVPDECELASQPGIRGEYYSNQGLAGQPVLRTDAQVWFDWGSGAPVAGVSADSFSVRWTGYIRTPAASGQYVFSTITDDGVRLWVDGQQLIDKWFNQTNAEWTGTITLAGNSIYPITMEYYENSSNAVAKLAWEPPGEPRAAIPAEALFSDANNDCNANGVPDACDIDSGASDDNNADGVPDECEIDCNGNGEYDFRDIELGVSEDCNINGVPDACDIAAGTSEDLDASGVPDECEADCNNNGVGDIEDILAGASLDENGNLVPDECEVDCNNNGVDDPQDIASGASHDCNDNDIPDECDIADGTEQDCNANGVPDVCDLYREPLTLASDVPAQFGWIEISGSGAPLGLGDNDVAGIVSPFTNEIVFDTALQIANNGGVGIGGTLALAQTNQPLPSGDAFGGAAALLPMWDDIDSDTGEVYWEVVGAEPDRVLVVQWQDRPHYFGDAILDGDEVTFQVQLFESAPAGVYAQMLYADTDFLDLFLNHGKSATVGYQDGLGGAWQWSYNQYNALDPSLVLTVYWPPATSADDNGDGVPDECSVYALGDMNCDGSVNSRDIDGFVLAITNETGYAQAHPDCDVNLADCNGDGSISSRDIDAFVALLVGG